MSVAKTPTDELRREHERILQVVDAFERTVERAAKGEFAWEALADFLTFFRLYVGACHHGKEEDLLFPELEAQGMSREEGPLAVMLEEHRRGRSLLGEMSRALPGACRGEAVSSADLAGAARDYVDLIRRHIGKENPAVFDTADRLLCGMACRRLCEAYRSASGRRFDDLTAQDLERLADRVLDPRV